MLYLIFFVVVCCLEVVVVVDVQQKKNERPLSFFHKDDASTKTVCIIDFGPRPPTRLTESNG